MSIHCRDKLEIIQDTHNDFAIMLFKFLIRKINSEVNLNKWNVNENEYYESFLENLVSSSLEPLTSYIPAFLKNGSDVQLDHLKTDFEDECHYSVYKHVFTTAKIIHHKKIKMYYKIKRKEFLIEISTFYLFLSYFYNLTNS